ncbi:hypothetical protein [Mesorhizobium sp. M0587]|uniref:hypothetical protein n=1 Tax=Mesorhizobium sp. M0587 TaxID=2956964 RepID=UPI00333A8E14
MSKDGLSMATGRHWPESAARTIHDLATAKGQWTRMDARFGCSWALQIKKHHTGNKRCRQRSRGS